MKPTPDSTRPGARESVAEARRHGGELLAARRQELARELEARARRIERTRGSQPRPT